MVLRILIYHVEWYHDSIRNYLIGSHFWSNGYVDLPESPSTSKFPNAAGLFNIYVNGQYEYHIVRGSPKYLNFIIEVNMKK